MKYSFTSIGKVLTIVIYPVLIYSIFTVLATTDLFVANLLLLVPTLVNGVLLFSFGRTLVYPPTVIEKIAGTMTKDLRKENNELKHKVEETESLTCNLPIIKLKVEVYTTFFIW